MAVNFSPIDQNYENVGSINLHQPLLSNVQSSAMSNRKIILYKGIMGGVAACGAVGVALSSWGLRSVLSEFTTTCADELNTFSDALIECRAPFQSKLILYESILVISSSILGYLGQKLCEYNPKTQGIYLQKEQVSSPIIKKSLTHRINEKIKYSVAYLQTHYAYECSLGIGYLFNTCLGLTFPAPPSAWFNYFNCQAISIGLGAGFLGMYIRAQQVGIVHLYKTKKVLNQDEAQIRIKEHWKLLTISGLASVIFVAAYIPNIPMSLKARVVTKEVSSMLFIRPVGYFIGTWFEIKHHTMQPSLKAKFVSAISAVLNLQSPIIVAGYYIYLNNPSELPRLASMMMIGFAEGLKDSRYAPTDLHIDNAKNSNQDKRCKQILYKSLKICKDYGPPVALISFAIVSSQLHLLECSNIEMYVCPISFDFSGNYVNFDGKGLNTMIITGLVAYYTRKLLRFIHKKTEKKQQITAKVLQLSDKYQFDLLSAIPYAVFQSGVYIKAYNAFASYNPPAVLILVGLTFGTYKDQVDSQLSPQFQAGFTNIGTIINPI